MIPMSTPKFCSNCGTGLQEGAKFCASCGTPVPKASTPAPGLSDPAAEAPDADASGGEAKAAADEPKAAPAPKEAPKPKAEAKPAAAPKAGDEQGGGKFKDPLASVLDDDDDDDYDLSDDALGMPDGDDPLAGSKSGPPVGLIAGGVFAVIVLGAIGYIAADDELNARFQCNVLGKRDKCITEEDRLYKLELEKKKEELALMAHRYGGFDLNFAPEDQTGFTIVQKRFEESREDFIKRVKDGGADKRVLKETKTGIGTKGKKNDEGAVKLFVRFKADANGESTFVPKPPKITPLEGATVDEKTGELSAKKIETEKLLLPVSLPELPLLEREQYTPEGEHLKAADDVERFKKECDAKLAKLKAEAEEGETVDDSICEPTTKAISTYAYEIKLFTPPSHDLMNPDAPREPPYYSRNILFYDEPVPPGLNIKKLEEQTIDNPKDELEGEFEARWTVKKFKRRPDGRFTIENASFDLLPKPRTISTRYMWLLKEIHCLKKTKEFQGKPENLQNEAIELLWEQKAFGDAKKKIAQSLDNDEEFVAKRDEELKTHECPEAVE
jgi:hypothetical protein